MYLLVLLQSNGDWTVTYSSSNVCALRGATVDINCTYEYPDNVQYRPTTVKPLWFTKASNYQPVVLEHDTEYTGRVEFSRGEVNCTGARCHGTCTLRIRDLRQSDSAVYKFRFTTNQPGGEYTGDPGVKLSVTDLQVKVSFPDPTSPTKAKLECHSLCGLAGDPHYIWFRNGQNVLQGMNYWIYIQSGYSYSCAVEGYEHQHSPLVYAPKTPSVTASPSGEIEEGSSVTLSCSSDANPAANYTWFRVNRDGSSRYMNQGPQLIFRRILSSDSGRYRTYRCQAENKYGQLRSNLLFMDVKYAPKTSSVTVSPSGEIEEGSSVTLSCSSDANPAAKYTWFKNNRRLLWGPSQSHTFPSVHPEGRGTYRCHAENKYGQLTSNSIFLNVTCELTI
uniref:B-cell receptor CD22 n=1 Tax=Gadus morhua TaxID=8049 RepID=A0A8C5BU88_GADMO